MSVSETARCWYWLVHKDLLRECRAHRIWPGMLLLAIALQVLIGLAIEIPREQRTDLVSSSFWIIVLFAGTMSLDRTIADECENGCWQALLLYPVSPATVFIAKTTVNFLALVCLESILIPTFLILSDVPMLARPGPLAAVLLIADLGIASIGTLVSALTNRLRQRNSLLVLLLLPLISPVVLAGAKATGLALTVGVGDEWWRWVQLLTVFAVVFLTVGALVYEFVVEE